MSRRDPAPSRRGRRVSRPWRAVIQSLAFVRKEIVEIVRQPRLIALLVIGPFTLLLLFGTGYRDEDLGLRTIFVGERGSVFEAAIEDYEDVLDRFVDPRGFTDDESAALSDLEQGEVDVVVRFPADPVAEVLSGERSTIDVLHRELNPIQITAVRIAAQLAVQEVNAQVLTRVATEAQEAIRPVDELVTVLADGTSQLAAAAESGDGEAAARYAELIASSAAEMGSVVGDSSVVLDRLGAGDDETTNAVLSRLDTIVAEADEIRDGGADDLADRAERLATEVAEVSSAVSSVTTIDPAVLVRPFESDTASIVPVSIGPTDFFTPSSLALLVQHLAITFAALSIVRDRQLGLFELLQVGPVSSFEIVAGKTLAYVAVGLAVGGALLAAAVTLLGVPLQGSVAWAVGTIALVLVASIAMGLLVSLISRSETQAVQWAMLTLLAGLFFSGFVLDLGALTYPVKIISWILPVTYGIRMLQDVLLRGIDPSVIDIAGLGGLVVLYGGLATALLNRQLRTA